MPIYTNIDITEALPFRAQKAGPRGGRHLMNHSFDLNEHLVNAVQHSNDAIMTKTLDGTVLTWNPAAERMFGYAASEMVGQKLLKILPSDRVHEEDFVLSQVAAALHEGKQPVPWKMADAPPDYLQDLLKNIVGIQIGITRLIGKNKRMRPAHPPFRRELNLFTA